MMSTAPELRPGDEGFDGFRMRLPEDCVEYMLFILGNKTDNNNTPSLESVRKAAEKKLDELAKDYIWQREPFRLETRIQKGSGVSYLHGTTHYGDNVEDEWLIVYLLRELSRAFPALWIRVSDSDGEFLLIEAAKVLPKWLSPENDANRVWIHEGKLLIIPLAPDMPETIKSKPISLTSAISAIRADPSSLIHSTFIEAEAFYRLEKYPGQITASTHYSLVTIPRKLAYILHARPKAIAPATESFYLRDPVSLKPLLSPTGNSLTFPPVDLVTISVRFTKVLYAQLKSQHFAPPAVWRPIFESVESEAKAPNTDPQESLKKLARLEQGMKLTTGFEILTQSADTSSNRIAREVGLLLEDLEEDGESVLPTDEDVKGWKDVNREDDDGWMDIDYAEFEKELDGKQTGDKNAKKFGDATAQADLQKIVERFEAFLNDTGAGIDGADVDEMDEDDDDDEDEEDDEYDDGYEDEDKEVSFDEEQFARMMREMMGLPGGAGDGDKKGKGKAVDEEESEGEEDEDEDEEDDHKEIQKIMAQFESELKGYGALNLDPKPAKETGKIKGKGEPSNGAKSDAFREEDEESDDDAVDIDYNLAKNILESFKGQAGMAGPAGNLLGLMGMQLPRDEEDSGDEKS
ncbi:protein ecdysoneless [Cladorrhinum samala]|uniref:Protein ecdysoneless n=1 Tax=Cladorrhinum samala TaxID=585594 RepID=A0AAV9HV31_9PEZI|nr:protein ecdysoneless [Cladorrhinum samala]